MSRDKEIAYQQAYKPHLKLLPGLAAFMEKAKQEGIKMGIGSAAITFNIDFVLDGLGIRHYFDAIVSADDVQISKPDPETFTKCADQLGWPMATAWCSKTLPKVWRPLKGPACNRW